MMRKLAVEFLGTAILVFVACGVATLMFGFKFAGTSVAAGVVATALAFGLTLLALVYFIGPVSGSHVSPAVTVAPCSPAASHCLRPLAIGSPNSAAESSAHSFCGDVQLLAVLRQDGHRPGRRRLRSPVDDPHRRRRRLSPSR
jgi:Major intrinsic protein